jgi:4-hydroxy-tetrahydrodipicolinate reductase
LSAKTRKFQISDFKFQIGAPSFCNALNFSTRQLINSTMNLALIGYGKMGHIIEQVARQRGHQIVCTIDKDNQADFASTAFASADVAIEFTMPAVAVDNYRRAWAAGVPVVSGTTGWTAQLPAIRREVEQGGHTLFWSSNFSLGVNIFFELNRHLAQLMNRFPNYEPSLTEIHHTEKKDAPSGTAITLAEGILAELPRKEKWVLGAKTSDSELPIEAIRQGQVPGTHTVRYDSAEDCITITHEAKSRAGFALGAVLAAEFVKGRKGFFTMHDMLQF